MGEMKRARSHVERCLQDVWEVCRVTADLDGDYSFATGPAACFVQLQPGKPLVVRVFAYAVVDVKRSGKLLAELNDVTCRTTMANVFWSHGSVMVAQALHIDGVSRKTLRAACDHVSFVANDIGPMLATVFGGTTPFPVEPAPADREAS